MVKKSGLVPLARARGFGPLPSFLEERAGEAALLKVFRSARLPLALETELDMPIPLRAMVNLFERSQRELGTRTLGLEIGERMTHLGYGNWMRFSLQAPSLRDSIVRLCATSWAHQRGFVFGFARAGPVWVWRATPLFNEGKQAQYIDHLIPPMMTFVQHYLGRSWRPVWVEVNYPRDPGASEVEDRIQAPMRFDGKGVALAILPEDTLRAAPMLPDVRWNNVELRDLLSETALREAPESVRSVSAVVALRLLDGESDLDGAAQLAGLSLQGLQRRLRQDGYTYREVLDAARRERAMSLLLKTRLSVSEIAVALGYEEHSNFTRAFNRWTGMSPARFRELRTVDLT